MPENDKGSAHTLDERQLIIVLIPGHHYAGEHIFAG